MNENHREHVSPENQETADQWVAAMESPTESETNSSRLGQAIRQSALVDQPDSNGELRELLTSSLDDSHPTLAPAKPSKPIATKGYRRRWWSIAAVLMLIGTLTYLAFPPQQGQLVLSKADIAKNVLIRLERAKAESSDASKRLRAEMVARQQSISEMLSSMDDSKKMVQLHDNSQSLSKNAKLPNSDKLGLPSPQPFAEEVYPLDMGFSRAGPAHPPKFTLPARQLDNRGLQTKGYYESFDRYKNDFGVQLSYEALGEKSGQIQEGWTELQNGSENEGKFGDELRRRFFDERESSQEQYDAIVENAFRRTLGTDALSTFSIDVDTASYANMRRFLTQGQRVPPNAVRIEELVNYFDYDYPQPQGDTPFSVNMELATCPWNDRNRLLRIGLQGKEIHRDERPAANLVFLIDVSGSMNSPDKLPLLKSGFQLMVNALSENDRVSIVTYANDSKVVLQPTSGDQKRVINEAIENLTSGGSTNGSEGIETAYQLAQQNFLREGTNKVILASDGDLNVGITSDDELVKLIANKASEGVFLSVLGFGTGNLKDSKMEKIADNGNGNYSYIDGVREAHKVLVEGMSGSLVTIAKDVKLQLEFNPAEVKAYRLIGYENRVMPSEDFANDAKDAGDIGAGHSVTALYELIPNDAQSDSVAIPKGLKYQVPNEKPASTIKLSEQANSGELLTLALRYKQPDANESREIEFTLPSECESFSAASSEFKFAASVAAFGMILRGSEYRGAATPQWVQQVASESIGNDPAGYRAEFIDLVRRVSSAQ